jgi:hypothetical protein
MRTTLRLWLQAQRGEGMNINFSEARAALCVDLFAPLCTEKIYA